MAYPRKFSHIGISVKNIEDVVKWYHEVFGFYIIMEPTTVENESDTPIGIMCQHVFGTTFENFKIAHLSTVDGIGIEFFEFPENKDTQVNFNPYQSGYFHFCIQDPDVEGLVEKVLTHGGKQRMPISYYYPGDKPYRMVYMEDPFGNVFEIYSHSYELQYSSGAY
jgi:lactoylglutathione lyase family protein